MTTKAKFAQKLHEVVKPYCKAEWCLLKEILVCSHSDARFLVQLKCVEHYKFELSQIMGNDVGWETSHSEWVIGGFAKKFAEYYNEDLTAEQVYEKIIKDIHVKRIIL